MKEERIAEKKEKKIAKFSKKQNPQIFSSSSSLLTVRAKWVSFQIILGPLKNSHFKRCNFYELNLFEMHVLDSVHFFCKYPKLLQMGTNK